MTTLAPVFDAFVRKGSNMFIAARLAPTEQQHAQVYYNLLRPSSDSFIVDMGCGTCEMGAQLQAIDSSLQCLGVVNDPSLVTHALALGRLCVERSFEDTGLENEVADVVMFNESIGHGDLSAALREAARILKPGGKLMVKDFVPNDPSLVDIQLDGWGYTVHGSAKFISAAVAAGFSLDFVMHPPMYMAHWKDIVSVDTASSESAALHSPATTPIHMALYRFVKGVRNEQPADCVW